MISDCLVSMVVKTPHITTSSAISLVAKNIGSDDNEQYEAILMLGLRL